MTNILFVFLTIDHAGVFSLQLLFFKVMREIHGTYSWCIGTLDLTEKRTAQLRE